VGIYTVRRKAVFLDRDGVLNRAFVRNGKPHPPSSLEELEMLPGVSEACLDLRKAGFLLIMVTNQPDVARGTQTQRVVEAINRALSDRLSLDDIKVCYHDNSDNCKCRKPEPGLFLEAAKDWTIDLSGSFVVGDRWKDIEAGRRAGCSTIFVDYGYSEMRPETFDKLGTSLTDAVDWILHKTSSPKGEQK
jgi:D-glycero-D-manno-heptose 1,7-bisphosphate phosphatase